MVYQELTAADSDYQFFPQHLLSKSILLGPGLDPLSPPHLHQSCGHWCGVIDSHVNLQMLDKNLQQRCSVYLRNQHLAYAFSFPGTQTLSEHLQSFLSLVIMCFGCPDYLEFPTLKTCLSLPLHVSPPRNVPFVHWFIDWKLPSQLLLLISRYRVSFPSFVPQYLAL